MEKELMPQEEINRKYSMFKDPNTKRDDYPEFYDNFNNYEKCGILKETNAVYSSSTKCISDLGIDNG